MNRRLFFPAWFLILVTIVHAANPEVVCENFFIDQVALVNNAAHLHQQEQDVITVWVHGTSSFQWFKKLFFKNFFSVLPGIYVACKLADKVHFRKIAETLASADPVNFPLKNIYVFYWSGALSPDARKKAGEDLYKALKKVVDEYRADHNGITPRINIITHSHGANVALNMEKEEDGPAVNRLIMLAAPVQEITAAHCKDTALFEEVFSLYSSADIIQIMDPQGLYKHDGKVPLFSQRRFPHQENVLQAQIKMNGYSPKHVDFILLPFVVLIPSVVEKMHTWREDNGNQDEKTRLLQIYTVC